MERGEEDPEADEWFDLGSDLLNELVLLEERAVFVLDNWHLAEEEPFLARWMEWFVSHLPEGFHLVLISRTRPQRSSRAPTNGAATSPGKMLKAAAAPATPGE